MKPHHPTLSAACAALLALTFCQSAAAQLVFNNGTSNSLSAPTGAPPVAVEVRNSAGGDSTFLNVEDGAMIGGGSGRSVGVFDQSVLIMEGGSATGDLLVTGSAVGVISGGSFGDDLFVSENGQVFLLGGTFGDDATVNGSGVLTVLPGGSIGDDITVTGSASLIMTGGLLPDEVTISGNATALFSGGVIGDDLNPADDAQIDVTFLTIDDGIDASGNSVTNFFDGEIGGAIAVIGGARVNFFGGTIGEGVIASPGGRIELRGGELSAVDGAEITAALNGRVVVAGVQGTEIDMVAQSGGVLDIDGLTADSVSINAFASLVDISGGAADSLTVLASSRSTVDIRAGAYPTGDLQSESGSVITLFGSGFLVNGIDVGLGDVAFAAGNITGVLGDGSPFRFDFRRLSAAGVGTVRLVGVPEPAAAVTLVATLIGLGGLGRRRTRRNHA